jgi:putative SOS response-associated peptidase YedK
MYNIRIEEIAPTYQKAWSQRRAIALVDGVIEWCGEKGKRRAHLLRRRDGVPLALAAAWQRWRGETRGEARGEARDDVSRDDVSRDGVSRDGVRVDGVLTASVAVGGTDSWWGRYSDGGVGEQRKQRMPRILLPDAAERFLDPDLTEAVHVRELLDANPFPSAELLEAVEIDAKKVNNPYYDAPDCVAPLSAA